MTTKLYKKLFMSCAKTILLNSIFLLLGLQLAFSQKNVSFEKSDFPKNKRERLKKAIKYIRLGDGLIELDKDYDKATRYYERANKFNSNNSELNYKLGLTHIRKDKPDFEKSRAYFNKSLLLEPNFSQKANYYLGKTFHLENQWDSARYFYAKYVKNISDKGTSLKEITKAEKRIREIESGIDLSKQSSNIKVENLGKRINTKYAEFGPVVDTAQTILFFTSRRNKSTGYDLDKDLRFFEDIYYITKRGDRWARIKQFTREANSSGHEAIVNINLEGNQVILYKGANGGDLWSGYRTNDRILNLNPMTVMVNSKYRETSAAVSESKDLIVFSSDRPNNSKGGLDLFYTIKTKAGWSEAKNLGENVNTPYDEDAVVLSADGSTLYFCSKGHNSIGGFDIFMSKKIDSVSWSVPQNLGMPINSVYDDIYASFSADEKQIYFSSNRPGGMGDFDVYMADVVSNEKEGAYITASLDDAIKKKEHWKEDSSDELFYSENLKVIYGQLMDKESKVPLPGKVILMNLDKNEEIEIPTDQSGNFKVVIPDDFAYGINITSPGYVFSSRNYSLLDSTITSIEENIYLQKAKNGAKIISQNILFEEGTINILDQSALEIKRLSKMIRSAKNYKVEIRGFIEEEGSARFVKELGLQRAKALIETLVEAGIDRRNLSFKSGIDDVNSSLPKYVSQNRLELMFKKS